MPSFVPITIHESQWPTVLASQLCNSLQSRQVNHKFHYNSPRQVRQWLRLHEVYSPARQKADFRATYSPAFASTLERVGQGTVHLIGLGCGGGQKEAALLEPLVAGRRSVAFTATDVSSGMVITALQAAWQHMDPAHCSGLVCDLAEARDLDQFFDAHTAAGVKRVITFFGMIPNFEPEMVRTLLASLLRPDDLLLCSANLAPGVDYRRGIEQVLPQYDNVPTREWLGILLADLGFTGDTRTIRFRIEEAPAGSGLLRIEAALELREPSKAVVEGETFEFEAGSRLRLFFSYRHTISTLEQLFAASSLKMLGSWLSDSGEEGVFLAQAGEG